MHLISGLFQNVILEAFILAKLKEIRPHSEDKMDSNRMNIIKNTVKCANNFAVNCIFCIFYKKSTFFHSKKTHAVQSETEIC